MDSLARYIDTLCGHIADLHDRYELSPAFHSRTGTDLQIRLQFLGELTGLRRALAIALGEDPEQECDIEGAADTYVREWRERNKR